MPLRYVINLILIVAVWFVLNSLIQSGVITNYWSGILITVGIIGMALLIGGLALAFYLKPHFPSH